jgi:hypothetical protein
VPSSYPSGLDSFSTTRNDSTSMAATHAADHDNANDALNKIEAELGILPKGVDATVAARLDRLDKPPLNPQAGTAYTLVLADLGKIVSLSNAAAVTVTVPTNAAVAFPVGAQVLFRQAGAGQVTVAAAGGVTLNARGAAFKTAGQYAYATLIKVATDSWELTGDITV